MRTRLVLSRALTIAAIGLLVACGDDPVPTQPARLTWNQSVTGIDVVGPDSLGGGQSAQFVANFRYADGSTKSATSLPELRWRSSNPIVLSVSTSGVVTASLYERGEAVITASIGTGGVQGTRHVVMRPKAAVAAAFEISQQETAGQLSYVFAVKLTESAGVPATVTDVWITFDSGWSGQCGFTADKLGQTRLQANETLTLHPLVCGSPRDEPFDVEVFVGLQDDNGYTTGTSQWRSLVVR